MAEPTPELSGVTDADWSLVNRRFLGIRGLHDKAKRTVEDVIAAAARLGCSLRRVYVLLVRYRADPTVTGLLDRRPGPIVGESKLRPEIDTLIDAAIETIYLFEARGGKGR